MAETVVDAVKDTDPVSEADDAAMDKAPVVKKQGPTFERIPAIGMKPPTHEEEDDGSVHYYLNYVTPQGKLARLECTENVWRDANQSKLNRKPRYDFVMYRDRKTSKVGQLSMHMKRDFQVFDQIEDSDESNSRHIELVVDPEEIVSIRNRPADITQEVADVILSSLSRDPHVASGSYIEGAYRVDEVRERDGYRTIYVNPRQSS
jgi:hypothetical protein